MVVIQFSSNCLLSKPLISILKKNCYLHPIILHCKLKTAHYMLRHVCIYIIIVFCRSLCCKVKVYFATKSIQGKVMKNHSRNVRCWQSQPSWTELNEKSAERIREGGKRRRSSGCRKIKEWKLIVRRGIENLKPISHAHFTCFLY